MKNALQALLAHPYYQENLDWGRPRRGHPEGSLRRHIEDLEQNLRRILDLLQEGEEDRLRLLIHVHDICKPDAWTGVLSDDPNNHAYLAREFLTQFCQDPALLAMTQLHDDGYLLYTYFRGSYDLRIRFQDIRDRVGELDLFLLFNVIDACIPGKNPQALDWFLDQMARTHPVSPRVFEARQRLDPEPPLETERLEIWPTARPSESS